MQNQYSLIYREEEREMISYCKFNGIGIIPYFVLNYGQLARPVGTETVRSEDQKDKPWISDPTEWQDETVRRVEKVANDKGWKMAQVAIAWVNSKITSPLIGISSVSVSIEPLCCALLICEHIQPARLEEAIIPGYVLTEEETKFLEELYVFHSI
jgi:aryl-alcohol dehydrogenase-like predicted oxidoreductase